MELERRLEQSRRLGAGAVDALTKERLDKLVHEWEWQLDQRAQPRSIAPRGAPAPASSSSPGDHVGAE